MVVNDRVYKEAVIRDGAVLELLDSDELSRLKEIDLAGYYEPFISGSFISRFEHSVGVYLLLRRFKASRLEQIAGLIHDVSHSAFSHCIDYVLDAGSPEDHSHQDAIFTEYVKNSGIPAILNKHELSLSKLLNEENFPLKETTIPDICADRLDYSFRTALVYNEASLQDVTKLLSSLCIMSNVWVFENIRSAYAYATLFQTLNSTYYSGFFSAVMFHSVGTLLRYALEKKYLKTSDLYTTDTNVIDNIIVHGKKDKKCMMLWRRMRGLEIPENKRTKGAKKVIVKSRVVDPFCKHKGKIRRVSEVYRSWKITVEKELVPKTYYVTYRHTI